MENKKKNLKRVLALALCLTMMSFGFAFADDAVTTTAAPADKDWVGQPYTEAVEKMMAEGIITGDVDGLFHPEQHLTRAQACKIVISTVGVGEELLASSAALSAGKFTDLSGAKWAAPYIGYAATAGIIKGYEDGSFRPSNNVTFAELCAMLVRAMGAEEKVSGTWPTNYTNTATDMGLLKDTGIAGLEDYVSKEFANGAAEKWMAAWLTYNGTEGIRANAAAMNEVVGKVLAPAEETEPTDEASTEGSDIIMQDIDMGAYGKIKDAVYSPGNVFTTDFTMLVTKFASVPLSKDVKIYTYGLERDYNKGMVLPKGAEHYRETSIYKYKNVTTKAWCGVTDNEISTIIVPGDVGFSGKLYGVINGVVQVLKSDGEVVSALEMLVAGKETTWAATSDKVILPGADEIADSASKGAIYEVSVAGGEITSLTSDPALKKGKEFSALSGSDWCEVTSRPDKNNLLTVKSGDDTKVYELNPSAVVYSLSDDGDSFTVGSLSNIGRGSFVRLYDFTKDDNDIADIVVIRE